MTLATARPLFRVAALFNWSAVLLFLPALGIARAIGIDPVPTGTILEEVGLLAIFLFGVGYWMAASAPDAHRGILKLGLAGKLGVVAIVGMHFVSNTANLIWMLVVSGDLLFAVLFILYLRATRTK